MERFDKVAQKKAYPERLDKSGKFLLKKGMNSNKIINSLRINVPVNLAFNNQERLENFAGRIGTQIEADSLSLLKFRFTNQKFLDENGFTKQNVLSMFVPNSYEFFWNTSAVKFGNKMLKEYNKFWTDKHFRESKKTKSHAHTSFDSRVDCT